MAPIIASCQGMLMLQTDFFADDSGCRYYVPSNRYKGNLSETANGLRCQSWSTKYPHNHKFDKDSYFSMDGSVLEASNYCRDPSNEGKIWCFTMDPNVVWEYCNSRSCKFLWVQS